MKRKLQLSAEERKRIELKFECMRRSKAYRRDYDSQQKDKQKLKQDEYFHKVSTHMYSRWFHFPLLPPDVSIFEYREKKKDNYPCWLEKTFSGLVISDSLCPQFVKIDSPELRKYLLWKRRGYKTIIKVNEGKIIKVAFPKGDKVFSQLDARLIEQELRNLKLSVDMYDCDLTKFREKMGTLFKEIHPLVRRFLYKIQDKKNKRRTAQNKATFDYLKTYDKKQIMSHRKMSDDQNQQRKFKKHVKVTRALIDKGQWHFI
jgi:hypothetical protein